MAEKDTADAATGGPLTSRPRKMPRCGSVKYRIPGRSRGGGARGHLPPPFFPEIQCKALSPFFPERQGKVLYFRTLAVISINTESCFSSAGKDDRETVYKTISFQISHRASVLFRIKSEGHVN